MELSDVMTSALTKALKNSSPNVIMTSAFLSSKYGATVDIDELAEILGIKVGTVRAQISREVFPVPVTKIGQNWYATAFDIATYFETNKTEFKVA